MRTLLYSSVKRYFKIFASRMLSYATEFYFITFFHNIITFNVADSN